MDLHIRRKLSCHCQQSQVCQDERICAGILCLLQKLGEHGNLLVPWQGVAGEIYLFAVLVRQGNCLVQLLGAVEIAGGGTHTKAFPSQIDGISAVVQRRPEPAVPVYSSVPSLSSSLFSSAAADSSAAAC